MAYLVSKWKINQKGVSDEEISVSERKQRSNRQNLTRRW